MIRVVLRWLGKAIATAVVLVLLYQLWLFAHVLWWIDHNPASTSFMEGIQIAVEKNLKKGRLVAGGSTISQQLAKNLFLSGERSFIRKGQEAVITLMIEATWSKRRILEVYLNVIEWGNGIYGAEAAAHRYYKTSAANLGRDQAAHLAAMVTNPRWYENHRGSRAYQRRVAVISRYMGSAQVPR